MLPNGQIRTTDPKRVLIYRKYEKSLVEYYRFYSGQKRISFLKEKIVLRILVRAYPEEVITPDLVNRFLRNIGFEKSGNKSFRVPEGHSLNPGEKI